MQTNKEESISGHEKSMQAKRKREKEREKEREREREPPDQRLVTTLNAGLSGYTVRLVYSGQLNCCYCISSQ